MRTRRRDGTPSALPNIVTWQPRAAPPPVDCVAGTARAEGAALTWSARTVEKYRVERRGADGGSWETIAVDLAGGVFIDASAPQERTWHYRVRAETAGVRGAPSPEIEVAHPDVYPPPQLTGLLCLPETAAVRLRWDPSPESGIRYKVFRRQGEQPWDHLEEALDGVEYTAANPHAAETVYVVKAMDAAGNQSEAVRFTVRPAPELRQAARRRERLPGLRREGRRRVGGPPADAGALPVRPSARSGADGVLLLVPVAEGELRLAYWNADRSEAAFCGNGTRCAARFAAVRWHWKEMVLRTGFAPIHAAVEGDQVTLSLPAPSLVHTVRELGAGGLRVKGRYLVLGVPHLVVKVPWTDFWKHALAPPE